MGRNTKTYLLLTLWSAVALLLLSPDSPLHGPWSRCDSAIFFTSGKALMNGLRPYVDFTDSKGPLLWLIYGVGYLLSPRSYTGVYVVSIFVYACTFYYNYKTARIFLKDENRSLAVTLLMTVAYFWPWFHFEVRAEDFATLPVAISLYYMCQLLYGCGDAAAIQQTVRRQGLVQGGCFMALVMIKYSIAAMQGIIILVVMWHVLRERRKDVLPLTGWMAAGAAAVAAPFMLYLWMRGAVPTFIEEYFVNTIKTIGTDFNGNAVESDRDWQYFIDRWENPALLIILAIGGWLMSRRLKCYRWVPLLIPLFFFVLASRRNLGYYYCICHIFAIYLFVWLFGLSHKPLKRQWLWVVAIGVLFWSTAQNFRKGSNLWKVCEWNNTEMEKAYKQISATMDGSYKPRILYLYSQDYGHGLWSDAQPAGRYWQYQYGSTHNMDRDHIKIIESGRADYIIINHEPKTYSECIPPGMIIAKGYTRILRLKYTNHIGQELSTAVYKKKDDNELQDNHQ